MRLLRSLILLLACGVASCVRDQFLLEIRTDADLPAWGDRVLVEVLDDDGALACADCARVVSFDHENFPVSFGVIPTVRTTRVRAQLYQHTRVGSDGRPAGIDRIDYVGRLPPYEGIGAQKLTVPLWGLCFGQPANLEDHTSCTLIETGNATVAETVLESSFDELDALLTPGQVNRYASQCTDVEADEESVCIAAGRYLIGDVNDLSSATQAPATPRLLIYSVFPFAIDKDEMTVGTVRELIRRGKLRLSSSDLLTASENAQCTYLGATVSSNDALPLNCISHAGARRVCTALDRELPEEAEWERVAGGSAHTRFPWGDTSPACDQAVLSLDDSCAFAGPVAGGADGDVTPEGVRNLAGNLAEWVAGPLAPYDDPCWNIDGIYNDAEACTLDYIGRGKRSYAYRGGSFARGAAWARSGARFVHQEDRPDPTIGFRCKRDLY